MGSRRHIPDSVLPEGVTPACVCAAVDRIVASRHFNTSGRMARLLRFLVEAALGGRSAQLKEYILGVEVFDRSHEFDPRTDPIVRVEARRLRAKLRDYYKEEGTAEDVRVDVPTGGYVPRFLRNSGAAPSPQLETARSVAVLPFTNLSPEEDTEYFSDGLTEELIHALTKVEGLTVVAWNTAARLREDQSDIVGIGRKLGVAALVLGSVRRSAGRVRVLVKLVETEAGRFLWSETYDRRMEDLFAIQQDISARVAHSLRAKLLSAASPETVIREWSLPAYDLYLRGRFHWNKRTPDGFLRALECFSDAAALAPDFARAYAGLADTYSLQAEHGLAPPNEAMPRAKAAALKALSLDENLAEAHTSLGLIESLYEWKWAEAGKRYLRAIEIHPGYATAHHWYACDYLALLGRFDLALEGMETAARLDPLSAVIVSSRGLVEFLARRMDRALESQRRALDLDPHYFRAATNMGRIFIHTGEHARAIEMLERGRALTGDVPTILGALAHAHALNGDTATARALIEKLTALSRERHVPFTSLALAHIGLGELEPALDYLERACERRDISICGIGVHPGYDPLRRHPRFEALLEKMGLRRLLEIPARADY